MIDLTTLDLTALGALIVIMILTIIIFSMAIPIAICWLYNELSILWEAMHKQSVKSRTTPPSSQVFRGEEEMSTAKYQIQTKLKTAISELALEYIAGQKDMTVGEYGQVYDSEAWERMLIRILREIEFEL